MYKATKQTITQNNKYKTTNSIHANKLKSNDIDNLLNRIECVHTGVLGDLLQRDWLAGLAEGDETHRSREG
jgi:hypothetical protein